MVFFIVSYLPERKYKIYGSVRPPINQKTSMFFKSSIKLRQSGEFPGLSFKYISCYSLAFQTTGGRYFYIYLNTSHVILYPRPEQKYGKRDTNLNTSHVILYLGEAGT